MLMSAKNAREKTAVPTGGGGAYLTAVYFCCEGCVANIFSDSLLTASKV